MTLEEAVALYEKPLEDLLKESKMIMDRWHGKYFDFCTIINGKSGLCSENCKYCAQSTYHFCSIESYGLLSLNQMLEDALRVESQGIGKYSIVTSGKGVTKTELESLSRIYKALKERSNLDICASHGLLNYEDFVQLKASGVTRIHNNLETSRRYFSEVCTTHTYDEKIQTIKDAKRAGLEVCSGGIIGMGESREDRIALAFELRDLDIQSVPINLLNPIEGTAMEGIDPISEEEFSKTCAIFRIILPKAIIRLAGGRGLLSDRGEKLFKHCINGAITGDLLTTTGNNTRDDQTMVRRIGYEI